MAFLTLKHIQRIFEPGNNQVVALKDISLTVDSGEYVAIMGESGAGKSTLLNIIATLDQASSGKITLNGRDLTKLPEKAAAPLAQQLMITKLLARYPYEISGGQRQRIAVARALITQPELLLADEPTGALDSHNATQLLKLFAQVNQAGQTILLVTHSAATASYSRRTLFIKDGIIYHELYRGTQSQTQYLQKINTSLTALMTSGGEENVRA